jgi:transcriptional regulator with XRE-family HTH domain
MATTPTRRKKRLGALLEQLRAKVDRPLAAAGELLRINESSVSRYETGHVRPSWAAMQALLGFYDASEADRAEAAALWEDAGERSIRVITPVGAPRPFREFLRAEEEADAERTLELHVVPGLLQTAAYSRAINAGGQQFHNPATRPERYVSARMSRQARLTDPRPLELHAVLDEAVIRRVVGGPEVMAEQLRHLLTVSKQDNVTIQIVPFDAGSYGTMSSAFIILGYIDLEDLPMVYLEYAAGGALVENEEDVQRFEDMFTEVTGFALTPTKSAQLIKSQVRALDRHDQ